MYEFHGWFGLSENTEEDDAGGLALAIHEIRSFLESSDLVDESWRLRPVNGQYFLTLLGNGNRRRSDADAIDALLELIRCRLPGSWGLLYERDDEAQIPPGPNAYSVRVLARGALSYRPDPFLSPCVPTIED